MLCADPGARLQDSPLSLASWQRYRATLKRERKDGFSDAQVRNVVDTLKARFDSGAQLYGAARRITRAWTGEDNLLLPFLKVPRSSINTSVDGARRFVAQSWPFARIRAVATINADLGTNIMDPARRFAAIRASTEAGKALYMDMPPAEAQLFSILLASPGLLLMPLGLTNRLPPFNTVISNVPGIREPMYLNGARMDGSYPASIVLDGVAMNITLSTYDQNVDFGIIACRRSMPQVQRIIDYMEDALAELEEAAGLTAPPKKAKAAPRRKSGARKAKPKAAAKSAIARKTRAR